MTPISLIFSYETCSEQSPTGSTLSILVQDSGSSPIYSMGVTFNNQTKWANSILAAHNTTPTILMTHAYLDWEGNILDSHSGHAPTNGYGLSDATNPDVLQQNLVLANNNIFAVFCGHDGTTTDGAGMNIVTRANGKKVYIMMANYQYDSSYPGYFLVLQFDSKQMRVRTYSPESGGLFKTDSQSQFDWTVDLVNYLN